MAVYLNLSIFFSQDSILLGVELLKHLGYDREVRKTLAFWKTQHLVKASGESNALYPVKIFLNTVVVIRGGPFRKYWRGEGGEVGCQHIVLNSMQYVA